MSDKKTLKVKLVRSPIGCKASHRATVVGLGLRRLNSEPHLEDHAGGARHGQQGVVPGEGALMNLNNIKPAAGSKRARRRVGRSEERRVGKEC